MRLGVFVYSDVSFVVCKLVGRKGNLTYATASTAIENLGVNV